MTLQEIITYLQNYSGYCSIAAIMLTVVIAVWVGVTQEIK